MMKPFHAAFTMLTVALLAVFNATSARAEEPHIRIIGEPTDPNLRTLVQSCEAVKAMSPDLGKISNFESDAKALNSSDVCSTLDGDAKDKRDHAIQTIGRFRAAANGNPPNDNAHQEHAVAACGALNEALRNASPALENHTRVIVTLPKLPPGVIRIIFTDEDHGGHAEVTFDPTVSRKLSQGVVLSCDTGICEWKPTAATEQVIVQLGGKDERRELQWGIGNFQCDLSLKGAGQQCAAEISANGEGFITIKTVSKSTPQRAIAALATKQAGGPGSARALSDAVPAAADEFFKLLAEVAVERAKSRGLKLLKLKLERLICGLDDNGKPSTDEKKVFVRSVFRNTCEQVRGLRLEDIANAGESLYRAVLADLSTYATDEVIKVAGLGSGPYGPVLRQFGPLLAEVIRSNGKVTTTTAQTLLLSAVDAFKDDRCKDETVVKDHPECIAVAAVALCLDDDGCDARKLTDLLTHPAHEFDLGDGVSLNAGEYIDFATRLYDFLKGAPNEAPREYVRKGVTLTLEVVTLASKLTPNDSARAEVRQALDKLNTTKDSITTPQELADWLIGRMTEQRPEIRIAVLQAALGVGDIEHSYSGLHKALQGNVDTSQVRAMLIAILRVQLKAANIDEKVLNDLELPASPAVQFVEKALGITGSANITNVSAAYDALLDRTNLKSIDKRVAELEAALENANGTMRIHRGAPLLQVMIDVKSLVEDINNIKAQWVTTNTDDPRALIRLLSKNDIGAKLTRLELIACAGAQEAHCLTGKLGEVVSNEYVGMLASLATAILDQNIQQALVVTVRLATTVHADEAQSKELRQVTKIIAALGGYAQVYVAGAAKDAEATREARKKTIEGLIDQFADRSERDGDWVWSLGMSVGPAVYAQMNGFEKEGTGFALVPISLPIGLYVTQIPQLKDCVPHGWHFGFSALDIGRYARSESVNGAKDTGSTAKVINGNVVEDATQGDSAKSPDTIIRWADLVAPTIHLGGAFSVSEQHDLLTLTLNIRTVPIIDRNKSNGENDRYLWGWSVGLQFAYYISFLDLN